MYQWIGKITADERLLKHIGRYIRRLPPTLIFFLCRMAGRLTYLLGGSVRYRVMCNMSELMGEKSRKDIARLCRTYFTNIFVTLYEIVFASRDLDRAGDKNFTVEGEPHLRDALGHGRGAILFTPHMGNFFYYYWYLSRKYSCLTVVTASSPELRPLYLMFREMGCRGLDYDATPPLELLRTLRSHLKNNGVVLLMGDFWRPNFPPAEFFGRLTRSPGGTAALALENRVPVVPFYGWREKGFCHRLVFEPPVLLHEKFQRQQRSEAVNELNIYMERAVARAPGQWFYWFNVDERWEVHIPAAGGQAGGATVA